MDCRPRHSALRCQRVASFALFCCIAAAPTKAAASGSTEGLGSGFVGAAEIFAVGLAVPTVIVGTYWMAGGELDGLWVPPTFAWLELGMAAGFYAAGAVWEDQANGAPGPWAFGMIFGSAFLGLHALISFSEYDPPPANVTWKLSASPGGVFASIELPL